MALQFYLLSVSLEPLPTQLFCGAGGGEALLGPASLLGPRLRLALLAPTAASKSPNTREPPFSLISQFVK